MNDPYDPDDPLIDDLRSLFAEDDPVPSLVTETAKAALGWRRLDADLAELLADSALQTGSLPVTRGAAAAIRSVSFRAPALTVDVEIHGQGAERRLMGQLAPPARLVVELQSADGSEAVATESDVLGRFRMALPASGSIRLRIALGDPEKPSWVESSWIGV